MLTELFTKYQLEVICSFMNQCADLSKTTVNDFEVFKGKGFDIDFNEGTKKFYVYPSDDDEPISIIEKIKNTKSEVYITIVSRLLAELVVNDIITPMQKFQSQQFTLDKLLKK